MIIFKKIKNKILNFKRKIISFYFKRKIKNNLETENISCILCNSKDFKILNKKDRYKLPITTVLCRECNLIFTNPQPTEKFLNLFYSSKMYRGLYRGVLRPQKGGEKKSKLNAKANVTFFKKYFKKSYLHNIDLLDFGCSDGVFLMELKKSFPTIKTYGIEPGKNFSQNCKNKIDGLFENISEIKNQKFDIITSFHVLEHTKNPIKELNNLNNLLKENGILILEIPNAKKYDGTRNYHIGHLFHFSPKTINKLLKKLEFNVLEIIENESILQDKRFGMKIVLKKSISN